jgi:hypothetical protein
LPASCAARRSHRPRNRRHRARTKTIRCDARSNEPLPHHLPCREFGGTRVSQPDAPDGRIASFGSWSLRFRFSRRTARSLE